MNSVASIGSAAHSIRNDSKQTSRIPEPARAAPENIVIACRLISISRLAGRVEGPTPSRSLKPMLREPQGRNFFYPRIAPVRESGFIATAADRASSIVPSYVEFRFHAEAEGCRIGLAIATGM